MNADWWKATPDSEGAEEETAGADGNDGADEEKQESSYEVPAVTGAGPSMSDPPTAATTSSGDSSSDKDPAPTPPRNPRKRERTGVAKVPFSRLSSTRSQVIKGNQLTQGVEAARKRRLRSDGLAEVPLVSSSPRKCKSPSASPPTASDSYKSGFDMGSTDSEASLDIATNAG